MPSIAPDTELPTLHGGAATRSGRRRAHNEDAMLCGPVWFAVADGMGGHRAGDVASELAVEGLRTAPVPRSLDDVRSTIARVNVDIRTAAEHASSTGMGTTLVAAVRLGDAVAVASIGDSRCYRLVDGALTQSTRDHSYIQELVDLGRLAAGDVVGHPLRHVVTRALGLDHAAMADLIVLHHPVGRLLLCSDGLSVELEHRTIGRVLAGVGDPQLAADRLVELAGRARDDVTAVVVDAEDGSS